MRRILMFPATIFAMTVAASAVHAGNTTLKWNACQGDGGVSDIVFPCAAGPGGGASMYFTFTPTISKPDFAAIDFYMDLGADAPLTPDFWAFTTVLGNFCNPGLELRKSRPVPQCASVADPWDAATHAIIGYGGQFGGNPNRGRIIGSIYREVDNTIALAAGTEYFGYELRILADAAVESGGACSGCTTPMVIVAAGVTVGSLSGTYQLYEVDNTCITTSGGIDCYAVPTRNHTWGQLKALYR